jgi:hypothetical protein
LLFQRIIAPFDENSQIYTLISISPLSNEPTDSSIICSYNLPAETVALSTLGQGLFLGSNIRSVCPPIQSSQRVKREGHLDYDDYYEGKLSSLYLGFNLASTFDFQPNIISFKDDFMISKGGSTTWVLYNEKPSTFFDFLGTQSIPWILEYDSKNIVIDSIVAISRSVFNGEITKLNNYEFIKLEEKRFRIEEKRVTQNFPQCSLPV